MLIIKNAHIPGHAAPTDILIADGLIKELGPVKGVVAAQVIDAAGLIVAPGLVDGHAHFRDPGFPEKEDIFSGAAAAARGGYTSVVLMANTDPCVDNTQTLAYVLEKGRQTAINIYSMATVTQGMGGREIVDMAALAAAGACGFSDDGKPIMDEAVATALMSAAARVDKVVALHEEDPHYIIHAGIHEYSASVAEYSMVERDLKLAAQTGATVLFQHISSKAAVELIRRAKRTNPRIHAEATPHHFSLTATSVAQKGTLAKMNPPLRSDADRLAIIEGIVDGTLDIIATDHAPHTKAEKAQAMADAPSGIIGLETALSLAIRELVNPGFLSMADLIERMSAAPARLFGLPAGHIAPGHPADLVIFDANATWTVGEDFASKAANSPFIGDTLPAVVCYTICGGRVVYDGGEYMSLRSRFTG